MDKVEFIARAIWKVRPDTMHKPWPIETAEQRRAYPHNPIAAVDLCFLYAKTAIRASAAFAVDNDDILLDALRDIIKQDQIRNSNVTSQDDAMDGTCAKIARAARKKYRGEG